MKRGTRRKVLRMGGTKNKPSYAIVIPRQIAEEADMQHGEDWVFVFNEDNKIVIERVEKV